jgi:uncharacterized membrane protein YgcG
MRRAHVRLLFLLVWLVGFVLVAPRAFAYVPPPLVGAVNDGAHLLSKEERDTLEKRLAAHRKAYGHEVVVFTLPTLGGETIEDVSYGAFNTWKVGRHGKDDGVLLVIATGERRTRIETGKGVGGEITDLQSKRILAERVGPRLKEGKSARAIADGIDSILSLLLGGPMVPDAGTLLPSTSSSSQAAASASAVVPPRPPTFEPTGAFTDPSSAFPEPAVFRYRTNFDAAVRDHRAAFAAVVVDNDADLPRVAGANVTKFCAEVKGAAGIVVVTRDARRFYPFTCTFSVDHASLLQSLSGKLGERLEASDDTTRHLVFAEGFGQLCLDLEAEKPLPGVKEPGFFARIYADGTFMLALPFGLVLGGLLFGYLAAKRGWNVGGGGGGGSGGSGGSDSSSGGGSWSGGGGYSGGSSSGDSGGGYTGGGGSSGGGGASDSY